jgi:glucose/mannose-6-phosphate isomerase
LPKASVLDSLDEIRKIDESDMLLFCVDAPKHYEAASKLARKVNVDFPRPKTVIVAGMGGSGIGGELLKDWARDRIPVPIEICREYSLPAYADEQTLVFVVSYSGETEESLSVFLDAVKRGCKIVSLSSGGKLRDFAEKLGLPHMLVPSGMAPRATLPYLFMPLPITLERMGLASNVDSEVSETIKVVKQISSENSPANPLNSNFSKTLASAVCGSVPVVYGFRFYRAVAQRFKTQFNENSKVPSKWEFFPELNHNEIVGWEGAKKLAKCFSVILIRDIDEPIEIRTRIETTKELMRKEALRIYEVYGKGKSMLARMCSVICVGDFTSVYLAVLRGVDPTPVKTINVLKERLAKSGGKDKVIQELERIAKKQLS